jgi:riboflavin synthase
MFTGLVQGLATVIEMRRQPPGVRLVVAAAPLATAAIGDSIALNGCCLTVVERSGDRVAFEAGPETLARTNLGRLSPGRQVNFESSLRLGDPLGGHFVTGHVDGIGTLAARHDDRDWSTCWFACEPALTRLMASKGSVAVDGVSLTLVDVERERFSVALIPHTLGMTTLGQLAVGDPVNLETDLLAKYVDRCVQGTIVQAANVPAVKADR